MKSGHMLVMRSWRTAGIQKELGKSPRNKHTPLKPDKIIKKGLCSVAQNDLMRLQMKKGDFCSTV